MTLRTLINSCLWICLLLILGSLSSNAQQDKYPFEFVGSSEPLVLAAGAENKVQVWNNTTKPLSLNVALVDEPTQGNERLSSVVELETKVLEVDSAAAATIVLRGKPGTLLKPGTTLTAHLVVSDNNSGTVRRRSLKLAVAKARQAEMISLVSEFKSKVYYWPWSYLTGAEANEPRILEVPLPLNTKLDSQEVENKFKDEKSVALLTDKKDGETSLVNYQGVKADLPGGTTGIMLGLISSGVPGEYTGKLLEIKTEESKPVTLTVISAHYWPFAALACLLGILLYYLMQWYLNVLRKVWELQEQETLRGVAFEMAEKNFVKTAASQAFNKDTIEPDFTAQRTSLQRIIKGLLFKNFIKLDENSEAYKGVIKQLAEMDEIANRWSTFAEKKLNPLYDALDKSKAGFELRPPYQTLTHTEPQIALEAQTVLAARSEPMSIGQFNDRMTKADELLPRLSAWQVLNAKAAKLWQKFDEIINAPDFEQREDLRQEAIKTSKTEAFTKWRTLWEEESFDPQGLKEDFFVLDNWLAIYLGESPRTSLAQPTATIAVVGEVVSPPEDTSLEQTLRNMVHRRIGLDLFYLLLVTAVAIYSGLNTLYFDKPFGTLRDYLDALVWGFGTKALLDLMTGAINKFLPTVIR